MRDDLLFYYERELTFLRHLGAEFAQKYPKVAGRLLLEAGKCEDPHVERMLEGFAFLAARVHLKIDDEFPEIVEALFSILYPNYLRPVPSMSVVQFHLDPEQGKLSTGLPIAKGSLLYSQPVNGVPCQFRTCYDTTLWPLEVKGASWEPADRVALPMKTQNAVAALRLDLHCLPDVTFQALELDTLRLFLHGEGTLTHTLIELLFNNCVQIVIRAPGTKKLVTLGPEALRQVGFAENEGMLPYPRRAFMGYRLLQEYFTFPEKFCFLDLSGFRQVAAAEMGNRVEVIFLISEFERGDRRQMIELGVSPQTFRLSCSPIINLFGVTAEPILLEQKKYEYRIVPDARRESSIDIFSVDEVVGIHADQPEPVKFEPFYSYRHANTRDARQAFWHVARRPSGWRTDKTSDVFVSLVDLSGRNTEPEQDSVTVRLTCTNRDLPSRLPFGNEEGDFEAEGGGPITRIVALVKPTDPLQPPSQRALLWRLVSQLSLNYLSLVSEGADAFREILRLNNFGESISAERQIDGILDVRSQPHFARFVSEHGISFARGTRVEIDLDEDQFVGAGVYTFASTLDVFLGLYTSMNSFTQLSVRTRQRKRILKQWAPRSGQKVLV